MRSLLPLTVYCISLVSLQQLLALPAEERPDRNRWDLLKLIDQREDTASPSGSQAHGTVPAPAPSQYPKGLPGFPRHQPATGVRASPNLAWARPSEASQMERRVQRARRHAHLGSRGGHHHPQLMRVGCVLGTCQVQNLSHRLYQLIGQSGREDSSPINPRSPHSYG
ncbi:protein ADM2a [Morone saxatilis]|uniref:protein ADM2a n=1 Tax=Morone saxatilis TaxID=34816 RepID=UPI0015E20502|nr:protein ADM2a [Morone saxatilis]